jgi:hypothetical protein
MVGLGDMVQWFGGKITGHESYECSQMRYFLLKSIFHHSIIPGARQKCRPRKNYLLSASCRISETLNGHTSTTITDSVGASLVMGSVGLRSGDERS